MKYVCPFLSPNQAVGQSSLLVGKAQEPPPAELGGEGTPAGDQEQEVQVGELLQDDSDAVQWYPDVWAKR